jgi:hypothetical protein
MENQGSQPTPSGTPSPGPLFESATPPGTPQNELEQLKQEYNSLYSRFVLLLVLVVIISGSYCYFLRIQVKATTSALQGTTMQATNVMVQMQKAGPMMQDYLNRFQEFGRTNPDFMPILTKYGLKPGATNAAPPAGAAKKKK